MYCTVCVIGDLCGFQGLKTISKPIQSTDLIIIVLKQIFILWDYPFKYKSSALSRNVAGDRDELNVIWWFDAMKSKYLAENVKIYLAKFPIVRRLWRKQNTCVSHKIKLRLSLISGETALIYKTATVWIFSFSFNNSVFYKNLK